MIMPTISGFSPAVQPRRQSGSFHLNIFVKKIWIQRYKSTRRSFDHPKILLITLNAASTLSHFPHFLHNGLYIAEMGTCARPNGTMVGKAVTNPFIYAHIEMVGRQCHRG